VKDHPLYHLLLGRWREMMREPGVLFWIFGFPLLMSVGLGLAFREKGPETMLVAVVEGPTAAEAAARISSLPGLEAEICDETSARQKLATGSAGVVVFSSSPERLLMDPSRPNSRMVEIAVRYALSSPPEERPGRDLELVEERTPGKRYIDFLIPGILGLNLMSGGLWGVGWALTQARIQKLLKRLAATPLKRSHYLASYIGFRAFMSLIEAAFLLLAGYFLFDVHLRGSVVDVALLVLLAAFSFSALGLLAGSRAQNPQTAGGVINLVTLPMFLLSGVFFSAQLFPSWFQPFVQALPLTAFNDALREIVNKGSSLFSVPLEALNLLAWGFASSFVALKIFRWT